MINFFIHFSILIGYFLLVLAILPIVFKVALNLPKEVIRKFQHIGYAVSFLFYIYLFESWSYSVIAIILFIILAFSVLYGLEKTSVYKRLFVDRQKAGGELKYSLIQAQAMFAILLYLFYYLLPGENTIIVLIAIMSWGIGDALAALLGKRFGVKKHDGIGADRKKTYFGSISLDITVLLIVFIMLVFFEGTLWWVALIIALIVSPLATTIEAYSKKGTDTTFLPIGIALMVYGLLYLFMILGVLS